MAAKKPRIGFVGQGYVGHNYADNFEARGFALVRYSLEEAYKMNKDKIKDCDVVFVCVPTPTTPKGFDLSIVEAGLSLVGRGKIAVIKSTILPGSTEKLQKKFPSLTLLFSPEFLSVATAKQDTDNPFINIVGMPIDDAKHRAAAKLAHGIFPKAPFASTMSSNEAEITKYAHNMSGYTQILTFNLLFDMAEKLGCNWQHVQEAIESDPLVCNRYANPVHKGGRGAGGACFIKDLAAFAREYERAIERPEGKAFLEAIQKNNIALLAQTGKDIDLLTEVYGAPAVNAAKKKAKRKVH